MERVRPGFEIPTFDRMSGFHAWNRFAAVNEEFVPMHMDDEAGRTAGNASAFGMGNLLLAYVHAALRQWVGDNGRIVSVTIQYRAPNFRGLRTIVGGTVVAVGEEDGRRWPTWRSGRELKTERSWLPARRPWCRADPANQPR